MNRVASKENIVPSKHGGQQAPPLQRSADLAPINKSKKNPSMVPAMPSMSTEFAFTDSEQQEEEAGEEKKLLAILLKLKAAKASVNNGRKRKHCERVIEDQLTRFAVTVKDVQGKFQAKRAAAFKRLKTSYGQLTSELIAVRKALEANRHDLRVRLQQRCEEAGRTAARLEECVRSDLTTLREEHAEGLQHSYSYASEQVEGKLQQLESWVMRLDSGSKQDKISTLIQTVLSTM